MVQTTAVFLIIHFYRLLVRCYPRAFREEFGEEMTAVFAKVIAEAVERGGLSLAAVCLRELRDLPLSLGSERWHDWQNGKKWDVFSTRRWEMVNRKQFLTYLLLVVSLLAIDWTLGFLVVSGAAPTWLFFLANIPFGGLYIWFEAHWTGTGYMIAGQRVDELWSFAVFFFVVLAQATLYFLILNAWQNRRRQKQIIRS